MILDPVLKRMKCRLEKAELEHLRRLCEELQTQLDEAERRAAHADDCADFWRDAAYNLMEELQAEGAQIGLTKEGVMGVVA